MAETPSGYDEDFVNAVEDDFQCLICRLPLKEPVLTICGHRFCKECLGEHFRRQGIEDRPLTCPADREGLDADRDVFPDKATERKILSFAIKCPSEGCDWTEELRSKGAHLASCLFKIVPCKNENCHVTVQRRLLKEHVALKCPWRIHECDHCSEPHPVCKIKDHIEQCSKFPVSCPNSCGASISREKIPNHTEYDCPLTIISCPYEKMGCESLVQRIQVESHLQSAVGRHLDLACVKLTNTEAKLTNTEAKMTNIEAKLTNTAANLTITEAKLTKTEAKLTNTAANLTITEAKLTKTEAKLTNIEAKLNEKLGTRIFIWKIDDLSKKLKFQRNEIDSVSFYTGRTESYGYKLKARIYDPDGKGEIKMVTIVLMKGEYDAILPWPFRNKLKITFFDLVEQENFEVLLPEYKQKASARPVEEENAHCIGCCILPEKLYSRRYLVDDTLFIQVEVSPP